MIVATQGNNPVFMLNTEKTSYIFRVTEEGLLEHLYYGAAISVPSGSETAQTQGKAESTAKDRTEGQLQKKEEAAKLCDTFRAMTEKVSHAKGTTINYKKDSLTVTEDMCLELSGTGKGDFREPVLIIEYGDGTRTSDFRFKSYEIQTEPQTAETLPCAMPDRNYKLKPYQLKITLKEALQPVELDIYYSVYEDCNVITRRMAVRNLGTEPVRILRCLSLQLDLDEAGYRMTTFGGNWGREMHRHDTVLTHGSFSVSSRAGVSSNRANPFVMLTEEETTETAGEGYAFNLVYSGDHYESCEVSGFGKTRFVSGINPESFTWLLDEGGVFETPEAVMTFTQAGFRGISSNMHSFIRQYIVRGKYRDQKRPVLLNSWEAAYFNISEGALLRLAKKGKEAGAELFVMDDGWFKGRNNDTSSLGDWTVDTKKLPGGVERLAAKVHELGMDFGIWVEPEMISENSDLYRLHPEYAMTIPGRENSPGRNQMLLDLTNPEAAEYVKKAMKSVFEIKGVNYVKWDMNRMFADEYGKTVPKERQGEIIHRYYIALYDIMKYLTKNFPDILFEGCASGGNRFDLGILCYMPQIWASDDTDAYERRMIQEGYSYGYPMSTVTAHVSSCPNHQTLRNTPLSSRFNTAAFGVLGYELNLCDVSSETFDAVKAQITLYKKWREVFFFGDFYRVSGNEWMVVSKDKKRAAAVIFGDLCEPNSFYFKLKAAGLDKELRYHVYNIPEKLNIKDFGDLVNMIAPIHIKQDSLIQDIAARFVKLDGEAEDYRLSGEVLMNAGIKLMQAFGGSGFNGETRVFRDFSTRLYFFEAE